LGECAKLLKWQAEEKLEDLIREARGQRVAVGPGDTVATLCDDYFAIKKGDWQEQGVVRAVLDQLIKPVIGQMAPGDVRPEHLKAMVNPLPVRQWKTPKGQVRRGCSESNAKKCVTHLRGVFDLAMAKGVLKDNPARNAVIRLSMPKGLRKPDKSYLAFADMPRLLAQLNAEDHLVIHIALVCALRPSEIFALKRNDVADGWIRVDEALDRQRHLKDPKTDSSKAKVSVPPLLLRELNDWLHIRPGDSDDLLFPNRDGRPRNRQNELNRMLKPAAKRPVWERSPSRCCGVLSRP
jgi:integrase